MPHEIQFWDGSKRRNWFMSRAVARKILDAPDLMRQIRDEMETRWGDDPTKMRSLRLWRPLLALSPQAFETALLADTPEAMEARENFPPFVPLTPAERAVYIEEARSQPARAPTFAP